MLPPRADARGTAPELERFAPYCATMTPDRFGRVLRDEVAMDVGGVMVELYGRIPELAQAAVEGLDADALVAQPGPGANPIGWLVWHVARVQDHHVSEVMDAEQVWVTTDWPRLPGCGPTDRERSAAISKRSASAPPPTSAG